jgi:hypothetical protein
MADEKRNDQIVDSNELSEQDLEQAAGGVNKPAADRANRDHAEFNRANDGHRK